MSKGLWSGGWGWGGHRGLKPPASRTPPVSYSPVLPPPVLPHLIRDLPSDYLSPDFNDDLLELFFGNLEIP